MTHPIDSFVPPPRSGDYLLVVDNGVNMPDEWALRLSEHWRVETAVDGPAALRHATHERPLLILVNVSLLQIGTEPFGLLHHIRQDAQLRTLPIILLTDQADEDKAIEG